MIISLILLCTDLEDTSSSRPYLNKLAPVAPKLELMNEITLAKTKINNLCYNTFKLLVSKPVWFFVFHRYF